MVFGHFSTGFPLLNVLCLVSALRNSDPPFRNCNTFFMLIIHFFEEDIIINYKLFNTNLASLTLSTRTPNPKDVFPTARSLIAAHYSNHIIFTIYIIISCFMYVPKPQHPKYFLKNFIQ